MNHSLWRVVPILALAGSIAGAVSMPQDPKEIEEALKIFNRAKYLHQERKYEEAINEYHRAAKLDKNNPFIFNYLGLAYLSLRDHKNAIKNFEHALELNPDLTDVHNNLGVVYSETGDREKAFQEFALVVGDPSFPTPEKPLYNLGELYLRENNVELALMHFRRAVEKNPNFAMGHRGLGKAYLALGEQDNARESFEQSLELAPNDQESLYELARIHDQSGDTDTAAEYYRRVVEVDRFSSLGRLSLQRLDAMKSG
jgi:Tfp pilus assembly protein PilF